MRQKLSPHERSQYIKQVASSLGFAYTGIAQVRRLDEEEARLAAWLDQNRHGKMSYMERYFDKRLDPALLVPGARSVISLMYNYYTERRQRDPRAPRISIYAYGKDYHQVLKKKLRLLWQRILDKMGPAKGRLFVDSAPVMERQWAREAGLGWLGKNTLLISKHSGSYFFLAEIICDIELAYDSPMAKDYCGTCTACIDACPTDAIQPYVLDASRCISYLTIELRDAIPVEFAGKMDNWMFGCDICQQVCPWNRFAVPHQEPDFDPSEELLNMDKQQWEELTEETFDKIFKNSAVKRTKFSGLKRNIQFLKHTA